MKIVKAYLVYNYKGEEIALLKAKTMAKAEELVEAHTNDRAFNYFISETEVNADAEEFGWYENPR